LIRDSCRLRPGIAGLTDKVRVISTVGRFLEHSRIYYFHNGGDEEYYIGSADLMKRNLDFRVEVLAPVESPALKDELRLILNVYLGDRRSAWDMDGNGIYTQRMPASAKEEDGAHAALIAVAEKSYAAVSTREQKKVRKKLYKQFRKRLKTGENKEA
ncbi:MAG: RNA degradosome polyphosphate kinase, partial [Gammaproteobacteria bacterium]|nr:RNA degradosome polyphosphate kinase [Gammaproteobacteria bacterium]NNF66601.1 RNA degradosome polyphosphate kinase [Gammaproteobacteria bacterium]